MTQSRREILAIAASGFVSCLLVSPASWAQTSAVVDIVRQQLSTADAHLDYLRVKLAFDAIVDPAIDNSTASRVIDRLTTAARELAGTNADDARKLAAVRTVIYQPGASGDVA